MTVTELLDKIISVYAPSPEALREFKPVFQARFGHREGPHLLAAWQACVAEFKPTGRQPFPIPADIEGHMPSLPKPDDGRGGPPIRAKLEHRHARATVLLNDWTAGQGARIKANRHPRLYAACWLEARDQSIAKALDERVTGIRLDQPTIDRCFQNAISGERTQRHGRPEKCSSEQWWSQLTEIAREWGLEITPAWWSEGTAAGLRQEAAA